MKAIETKETYRKLYSEIGEILFRHDLVGIASEENKDEYNPEVGSILPRLKEAKSQSDVQDILYEEFMHWFGRETIPDKDDGKYEKAAREIWAVWQKTG